VVSDIPELAYVLIEKFWPGPLTILFQKSDKVPDEVVCGQPTVGVRMPSHPIARKLIELSNVPIAAPSANLSGRPSPTSAQHVYEDLKGRCPCIIDGGDCNFGVESTVIDISRNLILRPGVITLEHLRPYIPEIKLYSKQNDTENLVEKPPTPGLKYRHYSPNAQVVLLEGDKDGMEKILYETVNNILEKEEKIGIIHTHNNIFKLNDNILNNTKIVTAIIGDLDHLEVVAKKLFKTLRDMEEHGVSVIIMEGITEDREGQAVMNRIRKATSLHINF